MLKNLSTGAGESRACSLHERFFLNRNIYRVEQKKIQVVLLDEMVNTHPAAPVTIAFLP